ncbi:MAG: ribose 5-phosphate isomerase B [Acidobacteria bacterium]|nr:MAG: ribose 5-phosphate isomerase B [Acidobacteriota bacterium]
MRIAIGSDHAGFSLKEVLGRYLEDLGYDVLDQGCFSLKSVDYPEYAAKVGVVVGSGEAEFGVLVCGTGIGISIAANKVKGIRAALCHNSYEAEMARRHNDANVLCMGSRTLGEGVALHTLKHFLDTRFEGDRHSRRVKQISAIEKA